MSCRSDRRVVEASANLQRVVTGGTPTNGAFPHPLPRQIYTTTHTSHCILLRLHLPIEADLDRLPNYPVWHTDAVSRWPLSPHNLHKN